MIKVSIKAFEKLPKFQKEQKRVMNKVIKAEVNKIRRSMDTGLLRNSLFYHCPNIMKKLDKKESSK